MSSSNRWTRTSNAEFRAQAQYDNRGQEFHDSQYDPEQRRQVPEGGYALRRSEAIPPPKDRTPETAPYEDHMAYCCGYRFTDDWFQAQDSVRRKRHRTIHTVFGPNNMSPFDRDDMLMDVISYILVFGKVNGEFTESLHWIAEFLKYLCGYLNQDEEDWFDNLCNDFYVGTTSKQAHNSHIVKCSKALSGVLRHCKQKSLFASDGSMNISDCFNQMDWNNPRQNNMSGAQFAAMLLSNPKQRFHIEIHMQWTWYTYSAAATYPFDVRIRAIQGHSNQVVNPLVAHHPLTYDEAMSLGWIFHVTDYENLQSVQRWGLTTNVKGSGKGGRDAVHFMYHNDNGRGYIRMAEGTTPPRSYRRTVYLVLDPSFVEDQQLFLTKNGVVLFHGDVAFQYLHVKEQLPTIACNVVHKGRGHSLPPSVTGGTWYSNTTWQHVKREKGIGFIPGSDDVPETVRTTAWEFMGQKVPTNYGKLVFGIPLAKECDFDPTTDSIHGLTAESSTQREASAQSHEPMRNPYEQPSRRSGYSTQRETPDDQWEQQRSSSGSSEPPEDDPWKNYQPTQDAQDNQQEEPTADPDDDPMGEEVVDLWATEDQPDDYVVEQATKSSISASNPWVLFEAGIICARNEDGEIIKNESGEKIIVLREWNCLLSAQKIALRRQSIGRADWEKLPWTGFTCFLLTRSWEMGRLQARLKKDQKISAMRDFLDSCRRYCTDWMRGMVEPDGWQDRLKIDRDNWREKFLLYERDLEIQKDMEYLTEGVFVFYTKHLDRLIRENDKLWGDFCRRRVDRDGNTLDELELWDRHIDMTIPGARIPMNKKTVIPEPEKHFSFSTKLMVMAIDLYEEESPPSYSPFTNFAIKKLRQFVDSRKEMTAQSYRFFVEHA